jgi:hypothetical protein
MKNYQIMKPKYVNVLNFVTSDFADVVVLFEALLFVSMYTGTTAYFDMLLYLCYRAVTYNRR